MFGGVPCCILRRCRDRFYAGTLRSDYQRLAIVACVARAERARLKFAGAVEPIFTAVYLCGNDDMIECFRAGQHVENATFPGGGNQRGRRLDVHRLQ